MVEISSKEVAQPMGFRFAQISTSIGLHPVRAEGGTSPDIALGGMSDRPAVSVSFHQEFLEITAD